MKSWKHRDFGRDFRVVSKAQQSLAAPKCLKALRAQWERGDKCMLLVKLNKDMRADGFTSWTEGLVNLYAWVVFLNIH